MIAVICEAFGCVPSVAVREIDRGYGDLIWRILDLRAFANMKHQRDEAKKNPRDLTIEEGEEPDLEAMLLDEIERAVDVERVAEMRARRG